MRKRRLADAPAPIADISPGGDLIAAGTSEGALACWAALCCGRGRAGGREGGG